MHHIDASHNKSTVHLKFVCLRSDRIIQPILIYLLKHLTYVNIKS